MKEKIGLIGVPQDLGASRRGVDMGPSSIRVAGVHEKIRSLGFELKDFGNINCHDFDEYFDFDVNANPKLRYLDHIQETCIQLKKTVEQIISEGYFPLILGGDHSITIGTMAGMKKFHKGKCGIIWVDAHGDFNTPETTPSGNIHGMPFAVITGRGDQKLTDIGPSPSVSENNSVLFAIRDIDPGEAKNLKQSKVKLISMRTIDEIGITEAIKQAIQYATNNVDHLHVSFDIDALDPEDAPGTGTRVQGGLTFREAHLLMEMIHDTNKLSSLEIVEVNPTLDLKNKTAQLAVGLIASALGKKIID